MSRSLRQLGDFPEGKLQSMASASPLKKNQEPKICQKTQKTSLFRNLNKREETKFNVFDDEKEKSSSLPAERKYNKLVEKKEGELQKELDSLEYFKITNLSRIGANSRRDPLNKTNKTSKGPVKAVMNYDAHNDYVFGSGEISNKDITTK